MDLLNETARLVHIVFGFLGLAAFWIPVFAKKGAAHHVRYGTVFVRSAYVVLGAAAVALAARLVDLRMQGLGPADAPQLFAFMTFLGYLTLVTFVTVRHGMAVLRHKRDPAAVRTTINVALACAAILASVGVILYAIILAPPIRILLFALSPIGFGVGLGNLRYMNSGTPSARAWLYEHLGAMLGAGIAFHTAFAVFGATRLFDLGLSGWIAVIPWVAPAAIGLPATAIWTRHYRRKFGELPA